MDTKRAWKLAVALAETHQKLQSEYSRCYAEGNGQGAAVVLQQFVAETRDRSQE